MTRMKLRFAAGLAAAMLLTSMAATSVAAHDQGRHSPAFDLLRAAVATARFHSTVQATRAGYGPFPAGVPLHDCISSFDNTGAMGFHWLDGANLTTDLDPAKPQVLVYAPDRHGDLHLAALEYVVFKADWDAAHPGTTPMLFGQMFMDSGFPNRYQLPQFYALHVWLWKSNPSGLFKPFNPNVSCNPGSAGIGTTTAAIAQAADARLASARGGFICSMRSVASA
jgi:hypothetical protein